jgi:hypothetical protein
MLSKKRLGVMIAVFMVLLLAWGNPILAADQELPAGLAESKINPSPDMAYINRIITNIYIDTYGDTTAFGSLLGYQGITDEVWIYLYLEQYVNGAWVTYDSWSGYFYTYYGYVEGQRVVPHGYYYRVRGSYYAWSGSNYEHMNGYSSSQYY